jgi:DNA-binding transcriptional LysR family regulator
MIEDTDQSWQRISLRHLVALHAVATAGSFRGGAERLGYSLSTVSEQIASLERLVAQPLVIRPGGRRAISITPAGQRLLDHADEIAARFAAARADLEGIRLQRPVLRLGIYQSVAAPLLPGVLGRLSTRRPDVAIEVVERADDGLLLELVARGEIDATFVALPIGSGPFATVDLLDDPLVLLVASDGPLGSVASVDVAGLTGHQLIDYREVRPVHHGRQRLPRGVRMTVAARSDDNLTIHALVAAQIGVAILPRMSVDTRDPRVRGVTIDPPLEPRHVAIASHRDRRPDGLADVVAATRAEIAALAQ